MPRARAWEGPRVRGTEPVIYRLVGRAGDGVRKEARAECGGDAHDLGEGNGGAIGVFVEVAVQRDVRGRAGNGGGLLNPFDLGLNGGIWVVGERAVGGGLGLGALVEGKVGGGAGGEGGGGRGGRGAAHG